MKQGLLVAFEFESLNFSGAWFLYLLVSFFGLFLLLFITHTNKYCFKLLSPAVPLSLPCPAVVTCRRILQDFWATSPAPNISNPCLCCMAGLSLFALEQHPIHCASSFRSMRWRDAVSQLGNLEHRTLFELSLSPQVPLDTHFQST